MHRLIGIAIITRNDIKLHFYDSPNADSRCVRLSSAVINESALTNKSPPA